MDPDAALAEIHSLIVAWRAADHAMPFLDQAVIGEALIEQFEALDEWLLRGGFSPALWTAHRPGSTDSGQLTSKE